MGRSDENDFVIAANESTIEYSIKYTKSNSSTLTSVDTLSSILRDPQQWTNFKNLLSYCDYYINYDSMAAGAIKNILIPFSQAEYWLSGGSEKGRKFFNKWLDDINFHDILSGMANDYFRYGQTYLYLYEDNYLQILPPHRCIIESLAVNGEPVISFELDTTRTMSNTDMTALERKYAGYPPEVAKAAKDGGRYAQLIVGNTYAVQGSKAYWERYALPILTSALPWLLEKETLNGVLINELENMKRSFLEVQVGDKDKLSKPNQKEMQSVANAYRNALSTSETNLAVVSWNVKSNWVQSNNKEILNNISDSITFVNWNILSALSISPILAAGDAPPNKATASSFSTTQASIGVVNKRINAFLHEVERVLYKVMSKVATRNGMKVNSVPKLTFDVVNIGKEDRLMDELLNLYNTGLLSAKTVLDNTDYDYNQELENKKQSFENGEDKYFNIKSSLEESEEGSSEVGRPTMDVDDRTSDPSESLKNEIPTPSDEL